MGYFAILVKLKQHYPTEPTGNLARHLCTLAAIISGIVGSKKTNLPAIANKLPDSSSPKRGKRESRIKRFARFLQNKNVTTDDFFVPFAKALLESLPPGPLVLVMDGSQFGRGCMALMVSVLYQHKTKQNEKMRALPLCWQVIQAPKGHFSQDAHRELLAKAKSLIPTGRKVIFLGDGEFDGPDDDSPMATLMLSVMGAFAEFERALLRERQREGIILAKQRGAYRGRKKSLSSEQVAQMKQRIAAGEQKAHVAREMGISRETLYTYLRPGTWIIPASVLGTFKD